MAEPSAASYPPALTSATALGGTPVNAKTFTVSGAHTDIIQTITTTATISGITAPNYLVCGRTGEVIYFEAISGVQFTTCTRGADSTTAAAMVDGDVLYHIFPANMLNQVHRELIAIETELGTAPKTIDDTVAPGASPTSVAAYLDMLANIVKTMRAVSNWYSAAVSIFNDAEGDPANLGTAADGTSTYTARRDHVHALSSAYNDAEGDPANLGTAADGTSAYAARRDHVHALSSAYNDAEGDPAKPGTAADGTSAYAARRDHVHGLIRYEIMELADPTTTLTTGDGKRYLPTPPDYNGYNLVYVHAHNTTPSTSGNPTFQIARYRTSWTDMLSTALSIDANESGSESAAVPAVINTANDDILSYEVLRVDCDVAGTGTKGLYLTLGFQRP